MLALTRHERSINALSFSPHASHLASAGDGGSLIIYSLPRHHRRKVTSDHSSNQNSNRPYKFWNALQQEKELACKICHTRAEDIMDISWSQDERRIMVGSLDHSIIVLEERIVDGLLGDGMASTGGIINGGTTSSSSNVAPQWDVVYRNDNEHTHYVQGVAYDPLGTYICSQGSDQTVRVWTRKRGKDSSKKKVLTAMDNNVNTNTSALNSIKANEELIVKFEVNDKATVLKYRMEKVTNSSDTTSAKNVEDMPSKAVVKKHHLFADESNVESFFRRLTWTVDGAFLITPASLWHDEISTPSTMTNGSSTTNTQEAVSAGFATYLFARHHFDRPYKVLTGLDKPSVVVRPNPVLFQLPKQTQSDFKENIHQTKTSLSSSSSSENTPPTLPQDHQSSSSLSGDTLLPYRSIFAVLTIDTVLIYDTYHSNPLAIIKGLHYAGLTNCSWTSNGQNLVVSSTDGYISILSFEDGELGDVYVPPSISTSNPTSTPQRSSRGLGENQTKNSTPGTSSRASIVNAMKKLPGGTSSQTKGKLSPKKVSTETVTIEPCEAGQSSVLIAPPSKRMKTSHLDKFFPSANSSDSQPSTPTTATATNTTNTESSTEEGKKRALEEENEEADTMDNVKSKVEETEEVVGGVVNLSLNNGNGGADEKVRKKKRIKPTLLCSNQ